MIDLKINLPDDFLNEEVRCGYIVTKKMKKVWAVELDLLCELLRVCEKYGLHCYADAGTLLGAVRHKGFIPWDDDIDMVMFREDYEKLKKIADTEFSGEYFFQTVFTDNKYTYGHAQLRNVNTTGILCSDKDKKLPFVQGIFIDIFVLDGVLENKFFLSIQAKIAKFLDELIRCSVSEKKDLKWRGKRANELLDLFKVHYRTIYRIKEWLIQRGKVQVCDKVAPLEFVFETEKRIRNKKIYETTVWLDFESLKIPAPKDYDEFLRKRYGEYMQFRKISTTHGSVIFDPERPYTEYLK